MKNYLVEGIEERITSTGKMLKKLSLKGEGDQWPTQNVTMWEDHELYSTIAPGQNHTLNIKEEQGAANPKGGYYKNRTVLKGSAPATPHRAEQNVNEMVMHNVVARYTGPLERKLDLIISALNIIDHRANVEEIRNQEPDDF